MDRLGTAAGQLSLVAGASERTRPFPGDLGAAVDAIAAELHERGLEPVAVTHRVVHGGPHHLRPTVIDDALVGSCAGVIPLAPLHLPGDLDSIATRGAPGPGPATWPASTPGSTPGCPKLARRLPVADELVAQGVRRSASTACPSSRCCMPVPTSARR